MPVYPLRDLGRTFCGVAKNKNDKLMKGVKIMEAKKNPQKPMRRFRPRIPAKRHNERYRSTNSKLIVGCLRL
jgi:hypothetical protein